MARAHSLILYRRGDSWRFAIATEVDSSLDSGIFDGGLDGVESSGPADAQVRLEDRVSEWTGLTYRADWRLDPGKDDMWVAKLVVIESGGDDHASI